MIIGLMFAFVERWGRALGTVVGPIAGRGCLCMGVLLLSAQCAPSQPSSDARLSVLAASSLAPAFADIAGSFEQLEAVGIAAGFGSSSQLRVQIEQGARADVYASADEEQMRPLRSAGLLAGDPIVIAKNRLVVVASSRVDPPLVSVADLARPGLRLAAAEPSAPIGAYALQSLDAMSRSASVPATFREQVDRNIVTREANVRQIVAKVEIGEVDAAIAYASDIVANRSLKVLEIPPEFNVEARYTAAVLRSASNPTLAQRFLDHLTSDEGQRLLERWGFVRAQ